MNEYRPKIGDIKFEDGKTIMWSGTAWVETRLFHDETFSSSTSHLQETRTELFYNSDAHFTDWYKEPITVNSVVPKGYFGFEETLISTENSFIGMNGHVSKMEIPQSDISIITIYADGEAMVEITKTGEVKYGSNYTPDAAGKALWEAVSRMNPIVLQEQINNLEYLYNVSQQLQDSFYKRSVEADERVEGCTRILRAVREKLGVPEGESIVKFIDETIKPGSKQKQSSVSEGIAAAIRTFK